MKKKLLSLLFLGAMVFAIAQSVPTQDEPIPQSQQAENEDYLRDRVEDSFTAALPRMIQCQFECVEVSHKDLTKLLFLRDQSLADATKLRKELQDMVATEKAQVVDTMMVFTNSGQRAKTESILEYIYPNCYDSPFVPYNTSDKDAPENSELLRPSTIVQFETRNVGGNVEVEPTLSADAQTINLTFAWEIVDHHNDKIWQNYKDHRGNEIAIKMPLFYVNRINTSIVARTGAYSLVGIVNPKNAEGKRDTTRSWLVFLKCEVQIVR